MNLAFSALLGLVLLLPGIIFVAVWKRRLVHAGADIPPPQHPLSVEVALAIPAAMILHLLWTSFAAVLSLFGICPKVSVNLQAVAMLLLGKYGADDIRFGEALAALTGHPICIVLYFVGLFVFSWLLAHLLLPEDDVLEDWRTRLWIDPLPSDWMAFFKREKTDLVFVTVVTELDKAAYLYLGELHRPYFDPRTRQLDRIVLVECYRRRFDQTDADLKRVEGDYLVIPYSGIKNLLVTYFKADEEPT